MHEDLHNSAFDEDPTKDAAESREELEQRIDSLERQNQMLPDNPLSSGARCGASPGAQTDRERLIADMARVNANLRRELEQAKARVEELAAEAALARKLKERLELIESSTSWRATAPFRALKDSLLRRKSRASQEFQTAGTSQVLMGEHAGHLAPDPADVPWPTSQEENDEYSLSPIRTVLILDRLVPIPDGFSDCVRLLEIIRAIGAMGKSVTFCSDAAPADYQFVLGNVEEELPCPVRTLKEFGVTTIFGYSDIVAHMKRYGANYQHVFLSIPEIMYQYLPVVRTYSPDAHVYYNTASLHRSRLEGEAGVDGEEDIQERARQYKKMETVNLLSADTVIAITENEREQILKLVPDADVVVAPNIQHNFSPQAAQKQISELLAHAFNHDAKRRDRGRR
jgi:hypothetical protein